MRTYLIERSAPGIGSLGDEDLATAARTSNEALAKLAPLVQWQHSYRTADKTVCVYLAENEELIHEHARLAGVPVTSITEVVDVMDPTTGG